MNKTSTTNKENEDLINLYLKWQHKDLTALDLIEKKADCKVETLTQKIETYDANRGYFNPIILEWESNKMTRTLASFHRSFKAAASLTPKKLVKSSCN